LEPPDFEFVDLLVTATLSMAAPQAKQLGVTPPISSSFPTDTEVAANNALTEELKRQNNFESAEETERRYAKPGCVRYRGAYFVIGKQRSNFSRESRPNLSKKSVKREISLSPLSMQLAARSSLSVVIDWVYMAPVRIRASLSLRRVLTEIRL